MGFVDEEDDRGEACLHLVDDRAHAVLELAFHRSARLQQAHVQAADDDVLQGIRHVAFHDARRQALDHGGLAHARLAREDGIVLTAAQQDIDHLADLAIAPQHGIKLARARHPRKIRGETLQRGRWSTRGGHAFRGSIRQFGAGRRKVSAFLRGAKDLRHALFQFFGGNASQQLAGTSEGSPEILVHHQGFQQEPAADHLGAVIHTAQQPRGFQPPWNVHRKHRTARVPRLQLGQASEQVLLQPFRLDVVSLQDRHAIGVLHAHQFDEHVLHIRFVVRPGNGDIHRRLHGSPAEGIQFPEEGLKTSFHDVPLKFRDLPRIGFC